jgi:hypothetical protein
MKTTIAILLFFNMSLLLHKTQINWNNCSKKTIKKIAFATVAVLMLLQIVFKSTTTDEKGYYEIRSLM